MRKHWLGWRFGGLRIGGLSWTPLKGYTVSIAAYHHPDRMCWLWSLRAENVVADEKRAFRVYSIPGSQAQYTLELWRYRIVFTWQEMGRYSDPEKMRQADTAKRFGVKL